MSLVDLFSPSFLMYLGIMVLAIAILVVYFETKLREQNHKIASMFSIVSTLAEDNNNLKFAVSHIASGGGSPILEENTRPFSNTLIPVSDDEDSDSDSDVDDSEIDDDISEDGETSDSDEEPESDNTEVKVLKISGDPVLEEEQVYDEEFEKLSEASSPIDLDDEPLELLEDQEQDQDFDATQKSIHINLEEESVDYKKLTLQKLKTIVVEKNLVVDSSKLKKPELLKLLGVE